MIFFSGYIESQPDRDIGKSLFFFLISFSDVAKTTARDFVVPSRGTIDLSLISVDGLALHICEGQCHTEAAHRVIRSINWHRPKNESENRKSFTHIYTF